MLPQQDLIIISVEEPAERTFQQLGYETINGPSIHPGTKFAQRDSLYDVLRTKLPQLNPNIPQNVYDIALKQIEGLSESTLLENNRRFHQMLLAGVKVPYQYEGKTPYYALRLIDFNNVQNNDFLAVRQFYVKQHKMRRLDHVIFINGIPLILLE